MCVRKLEIDQVYSIYRPALVAANNDDDINRMFWFLLSAIITIICIIMIFMLGDIRGRSKQNERIFTARV